MPNNAVILSEAKDLLFTQLSLTVLSLEGYLAIQ
jgi:hypothetical protein